MNRVPIRYLPSMLRDMVVAQGVVLFVVATLIYVVTARIRPLPDVAFAPSYVRAIVQQTGWIFVLICTASMVSTDRIQGFYRSIFSRPVSPPLYYLQRWLVGALLVGLMVPLYTLGFSLALGSFPIEWALVGRIELLYLLLGGTVFLASTVLRIDWLLAVLLLMGQAMLNGLSRSENFELPAFWEFVLRILPPFHLTQVNSPPLSGSQMAHVLLYGAGLILAALAILRWRPLGVGGRA